MLETLISFIITFVVAPIVLTLMYLLGVCIVLGVARFDDKGEKKDNEKIQ